MSWSAKGSWLLTRSGRPVAGLLGHVHVVELRLRSLRVSRNTSLGVLEPPWGPSPATAGAEGLPVLSGSAVWRRGGSFCWLRRGARNTVQSSFMLGPSERPLSPWGPTTPRSLLCPEAELQIWPQACAPGSRPGAAEHETTRHGPGPGPSRSQCFPKPFSPASPRPAEVCLVYCPAQSQGLIKMF